MHGPTVAPRRGRQDGWLRTGDLGRIDSDGHLYVLGRADEVIVTGGENVSPEEVENVLLEHPAIADAAVFGREDAQWQHAVVAAIVAREGQAPADDELRSHCRERLPGFKVPKSFEPVDRLPRNAQGKLQRAQLALARGGAGPEAASCAGGAGAGEPGVTPCPARARARPVCTAPAASSGRGDRSGASRQLLDHLDREQRAGDGDRPCRPCYV